MAIKNVMLMNNDYIRNPGDFEQMIYFSLIIIMKCLGAFGAVGALSYGLFSMYKGNPKHSQYAVMINQFKSKEQSIFIVIVFNFEFSIR